MNGFSELVQTLSHQKTALIDLTEISEREQEAIAQNAVDELSRLNDSKEEIIGRMMELERKRSEWVAAAAEELKAASDQTTISVLAEHLPSTMATTLRVLQKEIQTEIDNLRQLISQNALLFETCLGAVQTGLFFLTHLKRADQGYSNDGLLNPETDTKSSALDRRA